MSLRHDDIFDCPNFIDPQSEAGQRIIRNSAFEQPLTQGDPPPEGPEDWTRQRIEAALRAPEPDCYITVDDGLWLLDRLDHYRSQRQSPLFAQAFTEDEFTAVNATLLSVPTTLRLRVLVAVRQRMAVPSSPVADGRRSSEAVKAFAALCITLCGELGEVPSWPKDVHDAVEHVGSALNTVPSSPVADSGQTPHQHRLFRPTDGHVEECACGAWRNCTTTKPGVGYVYVPWNGEPLNEPLSR